MQIRGNNDAREFAKTSAILALPPVVGWVLIAFFQQFPEDPADPGDPEDCDENFKRL